MTTELILPRLVEAVRRVIAVVTGLLLFWCCAGPLAAQDGGSGPVDPRRFGLDVPGGPVRHVEDQRVLTHDEDGRAVVAKVHVQVGEHRIVILPDGRLVVRRLNETELTERPFQGLTKEQIAERLTATGPLQGFRTRQGRRYVYIYDTSDEFALVTSRILESMFPGVMGYAQAQRIEVREPDVPLVVIMFRTEEQFQQYQRTPAGAVAYYETLSNHVVMYEESDLYRVKPQLAIQQSMATIAHEGAHQILHNIGVHQRLALWPMWLTEGLAEFFAPTTPGRRLRWKGAGQVNDLRMFELEQYIKGRTGEEPSGEMVEHTVMAARLTSTGYASAWALTHYLARSHRPQFHRYVRELSRLRPLEGNHRVVPPGIIPENRRLFEKHFGSDSADLERRLVLHLKKLPYQDPFADWPHFVALVAIPEGNRVQRHVNLFHSSAQAEQWIRQRLAEATDQQQQRAQSQVRQFANRALAENFARLWKGK